MVDGFVSKDQVVGIGFDATCSLVLVGQVGLFRVLVGQEGLFLVLVGQAGLFIMVMLLTVFDFQFVVGFA